MKYIQFTYVDAITGVSVASEPAANGPAFPAVAGLVFEWARESLYPTNVPQFFGTCPDASNTQTDGVLAVLTQAEYQAAKAAEMRARIPAEVTMRQARLALHEAELLDDVAVALDAIADPKDRQAAQIEWEYSTTVNRHSKWVVSLGASLGLTDAQLDALFVAADKK